jgi:cysteine desulfurase/selenocysteine lyase
MDGMTDPMLQGVLADARQLAARLVNADVDEIALAGNTSWGINVAAATLPLERGDVVIVSDREFPANVYPWMRLASRGVRLEVAPVTTDGWPDEDYLLARVQDPEVKALAVSWVQFSNGYRVDLDRLGRAARDTGTYLVVDAIQGVGQQPLDLSTLSVDVLACGGQKWLLSPWGTGFLYVRRGLIEKLNPVVTGWMAHQGTDDFTKLTDYDPALRRDARRFELVSLPFQDFVGFNASLTLLLELGVSQIAAHLDRITEPIRFWAESTGVPLTSPRDSHGSGMVCVAPPDIERAYDRLTEAGIVASLREGAIRFSPHCYTMIEEMERVVEVLG